jgi:ribose 5-phosphate isomerase RpiB
MVTIDWEFEKIIDDSMLARTVAILSDAESFKTKLSIIRLLSARGQDVHDLGVYAENENCDCADLALRAANAIKSGSCLGCIAVSATGNGFQMYANKHAWIVAVPCLSLASAEEAFKELTPNMCDIYSRIPEPEILAIGELFVGTFKGSYSRSNGGMRQ